MTLKRISLIFLSIATAMLFVIKANAQATRLISTGQDRRNFSTENDSIDPNTVPKGYYVWKIDERFGTVRPNEPDTLSHLFQNSNYTEGKWGEYNYTGTFGSPRIARIYDGRQDDMTNSQFIFGKPYDWFLKSTQDVVFTNTKSPIANLNYHSAGSKLQGDDRFQALFATNINKQAGLGFNINYAYGRGYYRNQPHSSLGGTVYGSYRGEQYQMHAYLNTNHIKNVENGGLEDLTYITNPESFPTRYQPADMPVRLEGVKNQVNVNRLFLTHRYSVGYHQYVDSTGKVVKRLQNKYAQQQNTDSLLNPLAQEMDMVRDTTLKRQFVPVAAAIHTLKVDRNDRKFTTQSLLDNYFLNSYISNDAAKDETEYLSVQNTFALEMQEGFKKWVKTGMRLFAKHEFARFTLPDAQYNRTSETFNYFTIGAQLMREKSQRFRYNVLGEMRTTGEDWGEFNVEGNLGFDFQLGQDTLTLQAGGYVRNETPAYYYRHYHGRNAWWDNELDKVFRARVEGLLSYGKTSLKVGIESIQNYAYFQETQTSSEENPTLANMQYGVDVAQSTKNIQVLSATLRHDLKVGIFHWENALTLQKSSEESTLPLPLFNAWSNAYLKFRIAKVLDTELGADVRYFSEYYAPAYNPAIGQYVVQDPTYRTKIGNYPWVNAYVNFTLKGVRFYLAYSHVNSSAGKYLLVPSYPTNQRLLHFGISWTFFN